MKTTYKLLSAAGLVAVLCTTGCGDKFAGNEPGETRNIAGIEMVWCPPGEFLMGSPENEEDRFDNETQHRVRLTKGFWLAETECTQGQWEAVMGDNPSVFKGADLPVESVSWEDAVSYCEKLNRASPLPDGWKWSLPTEAQWEYACRAGTGGPYAGDLDTMAWHGENSGGETHPVGTKRANAWGLYDMHGNVSEWCSDWHGADYYADGQRDPMGPSTVSYRVIRGGWSGNFARYCRAAFRGRYAPSSRYYLGFRVAVSSTQ